MRQYPPSVVRWRTLLGVRSGRTGEKRSLIGSLKASRADRLRLVVDGGSTGDAAGSTGGGTDVEVGSRRATTAAWPFWLASSSAVLPTLQRIDRSAPESSNLRAISGWFIRAAMWSAVLPATFVASTSALASRRVSTHARCPPATGALVPNVAIAPFAMAAMSAVSSYHCEHPRGTRGEMTAEAYRRQHRRGCMAI